MSSNETQSTEQCSSNETVEMLPMELERRRCEAGNNGNTLYSENSISVSDKATEPRNLNLRIENRGLVIVQQSLANSSSLTGSTPSLNRKQNVPTGVKYNQTLLQRQRAAFQTNTSDQRSWQPANFKLLGIRNNVHRLSGVILSLPVLTHQCL